MGNRFCCSRFCIYCFLCIFLLLGFVFGLILFFSWISVNIVSSGASFYVQKFYVPALNATARNYTSVNQTSINFLLEFVNFQQQFGIYYDDLNVTFYYGRHRSLRIASYGWYGFHQAAESATYSDHSSGTTIQTRGVPWETIPRNGSSADFRVDLATAVRYSQRFFTGKRRKVRVRAIVEVNDTTGLKIKKKSIRLKSGAPEIGWSSGVLVSLGTFILLLFHT